MDTEATVRRWMAGLLAFAYLFDVASTGIGWWSATLLLSVPVVASVFIALRLPVLGGLAGAASVLAVSLVIRVNQGSRLGLEWLASLSATEALAGMMLIAIVIWRTPRWVAALGTAGLLAAALGAVLIRVGPWYFSPDRALQFAPAGVLVAVGAGVALRLAQGDSTLRTFLRAQWPLTAALAVILLVDTTATVNVDRFGLYAAVPLLAALATAVCAVLGPGNPVRWALTAAAIAGGLAALAAVVAALVFDSRLFEVRPPLSMVAAHMALIAYVVRHADRRQATVTVAVLVGADLLGAIALAALTRTEPSSELLLLAAFLLLVSLATGQYFGSRDRARGQAVRVAVRGAQQAERMALARELHDVVAHHVTGIVVQAQAAQLVRDPEASTLAMAKIERSGTEALAAMRMLVASMRAAAAGEAGAADAATSDLAADLRAVADSYSGPPVHLELSLPDTLPPEAGRTVLRVVQESLTNVTKHAGDATAALVTVGPEDGDLRIRVSDDAATARPRPGGDSGGYGLVGMRERIELLGGTFAAGPGPAGGWTVDARFPLRKDRP
ncbi:sensor histidine kinase [Actinokineospora sp. 24-640]